MNVCKDKKRKTWYISFKKQVDGDKYKTINIRKAEWKISDYKKKDIEDVEPQSIREWEVANGYAITGSKRKDVTFGEACQLCYDWLAGKEMADDTIKNHKWAYNKYLFKIVSKKATVAKYLNVDLIHNYRRLLVDPKRGLSISTKNNKLVSLKILVKCCEVKKLISRDLAADLYNELTPFKKIRDESMEKTNYFEHGQDDETKFWDSFYDVDQDWLIVFKTMFYASLRIGELEGLRVKDCNFENNTILISKQISKSGIVKPTKSKSIRTVRVNGPFMADLRDWIILKGRSEDELLFQSHTGNHLSRQTLADKLTAHCNMAGIKRMTSHGFRKSFATKMITNHWSLNEAAAHLGHANADTTARYYVKVIKDDSVDYDSLA